MKMIFWVLAFLAFIEGKALALLPPLWEGVREVKSILDDPELGQWLQSGEVLLEIKKVDEGWQLTTNKGAVLVRVVTEPAKRPGPSTYKLDFEKVN